MIGLDYPQHLWLSLTTPHYYLRVIRASLATSLVFLFYSCVWLGLLNAIFFSQRVVPVWQTTISQTIDHLVVSYPQNLVISWNGLRLNLQPTEEVAIPIPRNVVGNSAVWPSNLAIIIPEDKKASELTLDPKSTFAVVSPTMLFVTDQRNWNSLSLTELPGFDEAFTINQATLPEYAAMWKTRSLRILNELRWLSLLLAPLFLFLTSLWTAIFHAVLLFFVLRISGVYLKFLSTVKLSAHVVVAGLLLTQVQQWFYPTLGIPLASLAYWSYMVLIVFVIRRQAALNQLKQMISEK